MWQIEVCLLSHQGSVCREGHLWKQAFSLTSCLSSFYLSLSSHENMTQIFLWILVWSSCLATLISVVCTLALRNRTVKLTISR